MCICVYVCEYMCTCVSVYMCIYVSVIVFECSCVHNCMCVSASVSVFVCVYEYMYVCMNALCMCVSVCICVNACVYMYLCVYLCECMHVCVGVGAETQPTQMHAFEHTKPRPHRQSFRHSFCYGVGRNFSTHTKGLTRDSLSRQIPKKTWRQGADRGKDSTKKSIICLPMICGCSQA